MPPSDDKLLAVLKRFDFDTLFCDFQMLGWDAPGSDVTVDVQVARVTLRAIAQKRGVQVFLCPPDADGRIPEDKARRRIAHQLGRHVPENLLIFADAAQTEQLWLYPRRQPGKPQRLIPWRFHKDELNGTLLQKLRAISFTLDEEESLDVFGVTSRLKDALDRDRVTKSFYRDFEQQRSALEAFIEGLPDIQQKRHYVAILLNRLMFIYFLQNEGFLGKGDTRYLQNRLADSEGHYYRDFLCPLFFAGFAKKESQRSDAEKALLDQVPYLNGGIFAQHQIELEHEKGLNLPDEAFKSLFTFFDAWHWHLDDRPLENGDEINPDVLGYIFEKFINGVQPGEQKAKGAYYTKEDITGYITQNTVIPFLFVAAQKECRIAFENPDGPTVWDLLKSDPDRYIYPAVRKGVDLPLPSEIEIGVDTAAPGLLERRTEWNKPAAEDYALPTEIWRETVARRQRCQELRRKLSSGEVRSVSDLITFNLDIRQFALDVIGNCEDASLLRAFWKNIEKVTVLDPTCGSGAFLFAALDVLEPLYEVCLERMESLVGDEAAKLPPDKLRATGRGIALLPHDKHGDFSKVLDRVAAHANRRYFIYKSIILRNLYGVDIMEEAIEICKLRLFLKLAAQVSPDPKKKNLGIEPLPDIDFNIRAGNTLVGFASLDEVRKALVPDDELGLGMFNEAFKKVDDKGFEVSLAYERFRTLQTEEGVDSEKFAKQKHDLEERLKELNFELDTALAKRQYNINNETLTGDKKFKHWQKSHQPFHWYSEFYAIIVGNKGFDVIVGNPPYVVYSEDKVGYRIGQKLYKTFESKNLYSYVAERSTQIAAKKGWIGLIVQLTALCAEKMDTLQDVVLGRGRLWLPAFPRRPEAIFDGVEMPVSILISAPSDNGMATTRVSRFYTEERAGSLHVMRLQEHSCRFESHRIAKLGNPIAVAVLTKMFSCSSTLGGMVSKVSGDVLYYQEACRYWVKSCKGYPFFRRNGETMAPPHGRILLMDGDNACCIAACLLNSSLFYFYYSALSDCEHINDSLIRKLPIPNTLGKEAWSALWNIAEISLDKYSAAKMIQTKQGHRIEYREMNAALSKADIDEIDKMLAKHYGFTDEELDFIINYDIKYRMGRDAEVAEGEAGSEGEAAVDAAKSIKRKRANATQQITLEMFPKGAERFAAELAIRLAMAYPGLQVSEYAEAVGVALSAKEKLNAFLNREAQKVACVAAWQRVAKSRVFLKDASTPNLAQLTGDLRGSGWFSESPDSGTCLLTQRLAVDADVDAFVTFVHLAWQNDRKSRSTDTSVPEEQMKNFVNHNVS